MKRIYEAQIYYHCGVLTKRTMEADSMAELHRKISMLHFMVSGKDRIICRSYMKGAAA